VPSEDEDFEICKVEFCVNSRLSRLKVGWAEAR